MQDWFNIQKSIKETHYINKFKRKDHMTISVDAKKKKIDKIQYKFLMKSQQSRNRKERSHSDEGCLEQS